LGVRLQYVKSTAMQGGQGTHSRCFVTVYLLNKLAMAANVSAVPFGYQLLLHLLLTRCCLSQQTLTTSNCTRNHIYRADTKTPLLAAPKLAATTVHNILRMAHKPSGQPPPLTPSLPRLDVTHIKPRTACQPESSLQRASGTLTGRQGTEHGRLWLPPLPSYMLHIAGGKGCERCVRSP
jgi:hypothetical protein